MLISSEQRFTPTVREAKEEAMTRRYDLKIGNEDEETEMVERQNGDWVMADDYDDLVREVAELRTIITDAIERLRDA